MRLLLHIANLSGGGGLQVALSLLEEFASFPDLQTGVLYNPAQKSLLPEAARVVRFDVGSAPTRSLSGLRQFRREAARAERLFRPEVALTVFGPGLWRPSVPHLVGFANGLYLFNDDPFIRHHWPSGLKNRMRYRLKRRLMLHELRREGDAFWTETERAAQALTATLGTSQVFVVPNTPSRHFHQTAKGLREKDQWFNLLTFYAGHPNKNLELIACLLPLVQGSDIRFLVTLPEKDFDRWFSAHRDSPHLVNLGVIPPAQAPLIYRQADAVFLPSLLETFSATYPEAMLMDKPILASDLPFARDCCGDAALYFDPYNATAVLQQIRTLRNDPALQEQLIRNGRKVLMGMITSAQRAERILGILALVKEGGKS